jgi:hypothetical protein
MKRIATGALAAVAFCGVAQAAQITIYKQPHFKGESVTVKNGANDLAPLGITDQASSLVVHDGRWQVCTQPDFNGDCREIGPGKYATLDRSLNHRIESVRELDRTADRRDYRNDHDRGNLRGDRWHHDTASVELFNRPGFGGRSMRAHDDIADLRGSGFDERASSVVVNDGRWELCTRPDFRGRCAVLGPGRYPHIAQLDDSVSSLRQLR